MKRKGTHVDRTETLSFSQRGQRSIEGHIFICRFKLYVKLFMVMGITWMAELIPKVFAVPKYMTYVLDLPNTLQGLTIFIIFVWKKKIKVLLLKRLGCADRLTYSTQSSTLTEISMTSTRQSPDV